MQDHIPWKTWCSDFLPPKKIIHFFLQEILTTKSWIPPQRNPPSRERRALVVALRDISCGEEIYAFYGEGYWRARWAPRFHVQSNLISDSFLFVEIFEDSFLQFFFLSFKFSFVIRSHSLYDFRVNECIVSYALFRPHLTRRRWGSFSNKKEKNFARNEVQSTHCPTPIIQCGFMDSQPTPL